MKHSKFYVSIKRYESGFLAEAWDEIGPNGAGLSKEEAEKIAQDWDSLSAGPTTPANGTISVIYRWDGEKATAHGRGRRPQKRS